MTMEASVGKLGISSFVIGVIAVVMAFLPYVLPWSILFNWLLLPLAPVGIILGIIGVVKRQVRSLRGLLLCIVAIVAYFLMINNDYITHKASNSSTELVNSIIQNW